MAVLEEFKGVVDAEDFEEIVKEAKEYNKLAGTVGPKENPPQEALHTERSPEVKINLPQGALHTERSPEVKKNPKATRRSSPTW